MAGSFDRFKLGVKNIRSTVTLNVNDAMKELSSLEKLTTTLDNEVMAILGKDNQILVIYQKMMREMTIIHNTVNDLNDDIHKLARRYKGIGADLNILQGGNVDDAYAAWEDLEKKLPERDTIIAKIDGQITKIQSNIDAYIKDYKKVELGAGEKRQLLALVIQTTQNALKRSKGTQKELKTLHGQALILKNQLAKARKWT